MLPHATCTLVLQPGTRACAPRSLSHQCAIINDRQRRAQGVVAGAKIERLLAQLRANEEEHATAGRPHAPTKSVVFSQFTTMLTLVEGQLREAGIDHVRIDGSVPAARRAALLRAFASDAPDSPRVAVVSLKAGGVGLNLVSACQVRVTRSEPLRARATRCNCAPTSHAHARLLAQY